MASIFGHFAASGTINKLFGKRSISILLISLFLSFLPDLDVIGFSFGIDYASPWGHRGFTHSIIFALVIAKMIQFLFYRKQEIVFWIFFLSMVSHGILDAFTNGGLGVAFLFPIDNTRYFFSYRPIEVSPIGIKNFFSEWGIKVLISEAIYIGIPCIIAIIIQKLNPVFFRQKN